MKIIKFALSFAVVTAILAVTALGQTAQPRQEKLLNGLKILMWPDASAKNVEIRIRIHSGAAFDPQNKEGVMKMLAENIFPNEAARDFFRDDLGGGLSITTTYDHIEIDASGKPDGFLAMLETLAAAVASPTIDKETTAKLRTSLLAAVAEMEKDPAYVADNAVAARLFGSFPYGRPVNGTAASINKIDFADLIDAKQRFLTADNATVSVTGNFDRSIGYRAMRRFFGAWLKSDRRVPSTFRQPDAPLAGLMVVPSPRTDISGIRFAARGVARKDKDFAASQIFALIAADRLKAAAPAGHSAETFARSDARNLPGIFMIGFDPKRGDNSNEKIEANDLVKKILTAAPTDAEFASARSRFAAEWHKKDVASFWLDADTFGIANTDLDMKAADSVTLADVIAYAEKLKSLPMASVLVNSPPAGN